MENITTKINFSKYNVVFCDSLQALDWAYKQGLSRDAVVYTSAPALLWDKNTNIKDIEASRWNIDELEKFQSTILKMTKDVFEVVSNIPGISREFALTLSQTVYRFHKILYKSACLKEDDFNQSRLFIYVDGETGPAGNMMNSPWQQLLSINPLLTVVNYTLENDEWKVLTTQGVSYSKRFKLAGFETATYRLLKKIMNKLPDWMFTKEILIPNENELNIEIASSLALSGVKITDLQSFEVADSETIELNVDNALIYDVVFPIMLKRIEQWATVSSVEKTMEMFKSDLNDRINQFKRLAGGWEKVIEKKLTTNRKLAVLMNAPANIKGHSLSFVCHKYDIPLISSQHGVTTEISKAHGEIYHIGFESSVADIVFSYNHKIVDIEKNAYFNNAKHYVVGMPLRLIRMKNSQFYDKFSPPIVYISTNLYRMGFSIFKGSDYRNSKNEQNLINEVLARLPHKVCYKTYPEDNRRYADLDPVLNEIESADNIELFSDKIDMRYLISKYRIFVTSGATSTLGWPMMSNKPVVFINRQSSMPLTDEAYASLSKGVFVFNADDENFHISLRSFLSQPIDIIERLWQEKKSARKVMVKNYFSDYKIGGSGKRAAKILLRDYFF
jgi:hypothetical protein